MRLTQSQVLAIKSIIQHSLGSASEVWLFGSRVNDSARGGDIDLYVETDQPCGLQKKLRLITKIQRAIGLRKIDLIVKTKGCEHKSIHDTAKSEGVHL
ncbi:MAG: nucleotidyltransferase domain-containing protein [Gammaproteobacteria bacterium]|nr:nucleotidyltransferase domain-containing protein [Gammaproteobacteria bacterium]MCF6230088.1 nucleotidyltransferase domain-containing protein [Gammaproteobacteria bacterium]